MANISIIAGRASKIKEGSEKEQIKMYIFADVDKCYSINSVDLCCLPTLRTSLGCCLSSSGSIEYSQLSTK